MSTDKQQEQLNALCEEERNNINEGIDIWLSLPQEYRTKILLNIHNTKESYEEDQKPWRLY